ncbi:alpha/beta hydrolase [Vagococcus zengguangii]|uniref:Alpha/beta hydrolase n=1 Tax=Vagococcus zengguangii TaxID=2571750 RepID=A0A4D7CTY3_9ENTE|nr:alpha/beta hydrolase [Vagococcus zengguangii]QCI85810.1 alpha/beta hydrolase [Vagococcus zengguangii]TLG81751.1 alpha/beta hydrolase [Vagococcus zengguangii]
MLKLLKWGLIPLIILVPFIAVNSLGLSVNAIQYIFSLTPEVTDEKRLKDVQTRINILKDIEYTSDYDNNIADIYYPKTPGKYPVVFWIHGGAYVASSKDSVAEYAANLADSAQVAIISMNYELAPSAPYPSQLLQTSQMARYFIENAQEFPMLDLEKIFVGGDSAGGQIAAQYLLTQTNLVYGKQLGVPKLIDNSQLKGALLFCGPYEINQLKKTDGKSVLAKFLYRTVAWALIGKKDWQNEPQIDEASISAHLTEDFPPSFITDGNKLSFPDHAKTLIDRLEALGIENQSLFFEENKELGHEYQFDFTKPEAQVAFEQVVQFINKQIKN